MNSKTDNVMVTDCNTIANGILKDINDIDKMERMLSSELSSADLFKIDCAILSSLRNTSDFSRDLLEQLESGKFESIAVKPPKRSFEDTVSNIQQEAIINITKPLEKMFDEMAGFVSEAFI